MSDPVRVFVSYSRRDSTHLKSLVNMLEEFGFYCDYDSSEQAGQAIERGLAPTDQWWDRLKENIAECDVLVFCVSENSIASKICDDEIFFAQQLRKK